MNRIIINADDFGLNEHCSKAIAKAFEQHYITDTTMVATGEYFYDAVLLAKSMGFVENIGIHFNISEGTPLTGNIKKCSSFVKNGEFHGNINRFRTLSKSEKIALYEELSAQIKKLEDSGINITHADSHHHIHTGIFIAPIIIKVCKEHNIDKVRLHRNFGKISFLKMCLKKLYNTWLKSKDIKTTQFFGSFFDVKNQGVENILEIMVHPDFDESGELIDRTAECKGYPIGEPMYDISTKYEIELMNYGDL